jgi:hypothetical protein
LAAVGLAAVLVGAGCSTKAPLTCRASHGASICLTRRAPGFYKPSAKHFLPNSVLTSQIEGDTGQPLQMTTDSAGDFPKNPNPGGGSGESAGIIVPGKTSATFVFRGTSASSRPVEIRFVLHR